MAGRYVKLESAAELSRLLNEHYARARDPRPAAPVAWVTSDAPVELLRAMGIFAVYPENFAAACAVRGGTLLCEVAERLGYGRDLCSYARTSIGATVLPPGALSEGLGRPDLLIACNNICGTVVKWFEALRGLLGVPLFILDTPFLPDGLSDHAVDYVAGQMEDLVRWLEQRTGHPLDGGQLAQAIRLSNEAIALWREIRRLCQARPSPLNAPDLFVHMAPIVVLRGTPEAVAYYRTLRDEVAARVRDGVAAVAGERFRLLWDNIAIWPRLYRFFAPFAERGACFVVDTYTGGWDAVVEAGDPLESLAGAYIGVFLNRSFSHRVERMERLIGEYGCDGFVMHNNRSCKPYSLGQPVARRRVAAATGVQGLLIEADMGDPRAYAEEPIHTRIQAFLETLEGRAS